MPAPSTSKVRYRLLHRCNRVGCNGGPGDVVELSPADAEWFEKYVVPTRGAVRLDVIVMNVEPTLETATDEPVAEIRARGTNSRKVSK